MSCSINEKQQRKFDIVNIFVPLFLCLQKDIIFMLISKPIFNICFIGMSYWDITMQIYIKYLYV